MSTGVERRITRPRFERREPSPCPPPRRKANVDPRNRPSFLRVARRARREVLRQRGSLQIPALTPIFFCGLLPDERRLLPLGAPIPQNAVAPSLAPRRPARPCPALFLIPCLSLLHADTLQKLILFPLAHSRSKPARSAPCAVFHSYPRG